VDATAEGYAQLVELAGEQATLKVWAIEGTGGHGANLARHLAQRQEIVVELDRPKRAKRRNCAKSDSLDAIRAAREALHGPGSGPRAAVLNAKHSRCCWQPVAPRSRPSPRPSSRCSTW
jgi:transposase